MPATDHSPGTTPTPPAEGGVRALVAVPRWAWLTSGAFALAGAVLWWRTSTAVAASSPELPWWVLGLLFFVTERALTSAGSSRALASAGSGAGPIVLAMFQTSPLGMLEGLATGCAGAMLTRRPLRAGAGVRAFCRDGFLLAAGVTIFHPLMTGSADSWRSWAAAAGAAGVVASGRIASFGLAGADRQWLRFAREDLPILLSIAVASVCFGLLAVIVARFDPLALVVVGCMGATTVLVYRRWGRERQLRIAVEFLQGAGDALQRSRELETAVVELLRKARTMFNAELAQLTIFPSAAGETALRTSVRFRADDEVMAPVDLTDLDDVLEADTDGVIIDRRASPLAAEMLARRGIGDAMVALLRGQSRMLGSLLVGGHVDARPFDARDLQLFQTLAVQTTTTLENGRLERSIARLTELQEKLTHQAFHDALTGLANRSLFGERIDQALARSVESHKRVAVIFIDLDDFKTVNDTLGHAAGDALLVGVAERLRSCLRRPDTAARLGGDEFAVLLEDLNTASEADLVTRRIFDALRTSFEIGGHTISARASLGVAVADGTGNNGNTLMRHADVAMYAAKAAGKDRYVVFARGMEREIVSRHKLRHDLDNALTNDQLLLHYQPIVDLGTGELTGVEALARWRHPQRGLLGAAEFIPHAEQTGQILQVGDHVLRRACAAMLRWQARHPRSEPLRLSVNVSARQLLQPLFVENVIEIVDGEGLRLDSLVLELTESILVEDAASNVSKLEALRREGAHIAIDDFGTGYSSLSYLRRLPVDTLKIAKPFVDDLALDAASGDFARAIVGIGTALRLGLVAEGIESAEQVGRLRALGCRLGQGFFLSQPLPASGIDDLLEDPSELSRRVTGALAADRQVIQLPAR